MKQLFACGVLATTLLLGTRQFASAERPVRHMYASSMAAITAELVPTGHGTRQLRLRYSGHVLTGPDEVYSYTNPDDGQREVVDEEFLFPRHCYVSPDGRWVFVERKGMRRVSLGYLYAVDTAASRLIPYSIGGRRLDEAAWAYLSRKGFTVSPFIPDGRIINFDHWESGGRVLSVNLVGQDRSGRDINTHLRYQVGTAPFSGL